MVHALTAAGATGDVSDILAKAAVKTALKATAHMQNTAVFQEGLQKMDAARTLAGMHDRAQTELAEAFVRFVGEVHDKASLTPAQPVQNPVQNTVKRVKVAQPEASSTKRARQ